MDASSVGNSGLAFRIPHSLVETALARCARSVDIGGLLGHHAGSVIVIDSNFGTTYVISEDELRKGAWTYGLAQPIKN